MTHAPKLPTRAVVRRAVAVALIGLVAAWLWPEMSAVLLGHILGAMGLDWMRRA